MKSLLLADNIRGKRVIVRVDWNVPIKDGQVVDDSRIHASLSTLNLLQKEGAKTVVISHLESGETDSLLPVFNSVKEICNISFCDAKDLASKRKCIDSLKEGEILLLENLRLDPREKENKEDFAEELATFGEIFVNEAFSASHRKHASIVGIPKFLPSYAGIQFEEEVAHLKSALKPKHPFLLILGGAKFETKLPLLEKFINIADDIFVGGALAHNFFQEQGRDIKKSLVSKGDFNIFELLRSGKIMLPTDLVWDKERIIDAGYESIEALGKKIKEAKLILWNGPVGLYEEGFKDGTEALAKLISES
ncbi:MAG: phosphoglycerate kinase, partial [Parcubacteria group bacterium]